MAQSIVANTSIATIGRVLNVALGLVVIKFLTRFLGPQGYGGYTLLLSLGTILQLVADFGLYLELSRAVAANPEDREQLLGTVVSLRIALLLLVFIGGAVAVGVMSQLRPLLLPFFGIALALTFQSISQLYMSIFQYQQTVWRATIGDLVGRFAQIAAVIFVGIVGASLHGMALAFTVGSAVALSVHHLSLPRLRFPLSINWVRWKALLASSWPLGLMLLLNAVYFRIDAVILSLARSPSEVGWYGLAYRIIESCLFLPAMFGGLLLPRLSEARTQGQWAVLRQYVSEGLAFATMAVGFVVLTLVVVAPNIILFVSDPEFLPAAPLLQLLAFALLCMFFGNIFGFTLVALQKQSFLLKLYLTLAICNTLANMIAVPRWGAEAAASITVATEALATIISGVVVWRAIRFSWPLRSVGSMLVATTVAAVVYFILPSNWPVLAQVVLAAVGYIAGLVVTGSLRREQLSLLAHAPRS